MEITKGIWLFGVCLSVFQTAIIKKTLINHYICSYLLYIHDCSSGFSKLGIQGEDLYGAHLVRSLKENREITDWMDRQAKLIYAEVKVGDERINLPL